MHGVWGALLHKESLGRAVQAHDIMDQPRKQTHSPDFVETTRMSTRRMQTDSRKPLNV